MLHAFHVTENIDPVPLVQACLSSSAVRDTRRLKVCPFRLKQEHICPGIVGYQVDMVKHVGSDIVRGAIDNQIWVNVHGGGSLKGVLVLVPQ
jgi:hypothetical protein